VGRPSGRLGVDSPASPYPRLDLEPDAEFLPVLATGDEGATDQMLPSSLEFIKLLAMLPGGFLIEIAHDVAVDEYRNGCWLAQLVSKECGKVPVIFMAPWPGRGSCFAQ
jgi:hypothetical protein